MHFSNPPSHAGSSGLADGEWLQTAGIFFIGYACFQIPAAMLCTRVGAPAFLGITLVAWGSVASSFAAMRTKAYFYAMRFVLGLCETGAYPGALPCPKS